MDPFLQFLLGQSNQAPPVQAPTATPQAGPAENEIAVQSNPFRSTMREGLVRGGPFALGKTGGNILGLIGDALLVGGGRDAMYQPRLRQAREAEAMIDYTTEPQRAIDQLSQIDPDKAAELWDNRQEFMSEDAARQAAIQTAQDNRANATHERALAFIGAATPQTWPQIRQVVQNEYARNGVDPLFDLPEVFDEGMLSSIARGGIPMKDQASLEESQRYHQATENIQRQAEFGRNYREVFGEVMDNGRNQADNVQSDRNNTRTNETSERNTNTRTNGEGGIRRPPVRYGKRADGTRYVIRD